MDSKDTHPVQKQTSADQHTHNWWYKKKEGGNESRFSGLTEPLKAVITGNQSNDGQVKPVSSSNNMYKEFDTFEY